MARARLTSICTGAATVYRLVQRRTVNFRAGSRQHYRMKYALKRPATSAEWAAYHDIRRRVLFELRGLTGVYDAQHPDELRSGNHPLLLTYGDVSIGVIRVDLAPPVAIFRRVAVRDDLQRLGHGRMLLSLAEAFAQKSGAAVIQSYVDPEATVFHERCGFVRLTAAGGQVGAKMLLMVKDI